LADTYLKVKDMDRAVSFYETFLGVKAKYRYKDRWVSITDGLGLYNPTLSFLSVSGHRGQRGRSRSDGLKMQVLGIMALAFVVVLAAYLVVLRPRSHRWGATKAELRRSLPGDGLVHTVKVGYTQAITINAPPEEVWPWLVQIGYQRGGWYTYDWFYPIRITLGLSSPACAQCRLAGFIAQAIFPWDKGWVY